LKILQQFLILNDMPRIEQAYECVSAVAPHVLQESRRRTKKNALFFCMIHLKSISVFVYMSLFFTNAVFAEGRASVSFKEICLPRIADKPDIMALLDVFDIRDYGSCQTIMGADDPYVFPFAFFARLKGSAGPYCYLVVIDRVNSISDTRNRIISSATLVNLEAIGVSVWPLRVPFRPGELPYKPNK